MDRIDLYLLPNGSRVRVARDLSRRAARLTYQLASGEVVTAVLVRADCEHGTTATR